MSGDPASGGPGIAYDMSAGTALITMTNGDKGNPLNPWSVAELAAAVDRARADDAHVVVLQSRGKSFCAGGDLVTFGATADPGPMVHAVASSLHDVVLALHAMDSVVVSVVRGSAAGAGVALAAAADLVLAAESARFTLAYTRLGYSPDGGTSLLTASLGLHRLLALALLNPVLSAAEARAAGLVAAVYADDALDAGRDEVIATLRAGSRTAQVAAKRLIRQQAIPDVGSVLEREATMVGRSAAGADGPVGVAAFLARRTPDFGPQTAGPMAPG